jgi:hypothetical protein
MDLAKYCKENGYTLKEYKELKEIIEKYITKYINEYEDKSGMYFPVEQLVIESNALKPFIIKEGKKQGIEFIEDNMLHRV